MAGRDSQGNFIWLAVGSYAVELAAHLAREGVAVRPYPDRGIRVTVGRSADSDVFLLALGTARRPALADETLYG
jgi:histidinol-phosphate aminotransferase